MWRKIDLVESDGGVTRGRALKGWEVSRLVWAGVGKYWPSTPGLEEGDGVSAMGPVFQ